MRKLICVLCFLAFSACEPRVITITPGRHYVRLGPNHGIVTDSVILIIDGESGEVTTILNRIKSLPR